MKNDYVGFNDKGEKVTAKAHGGPIEIYGVTVANVDDKVRLQAVHTWMDPMSMFRQIAPEGIVNKSVMDRKVDKVDALDDATANDGIKIADEHIKPVDDHFHDQAPEELVPKHVSGSTGQSADGPPAQANSCPFAMQSAEPAEPSNQSSAASDQGWEFLGSPVGSDTGECVNVESEATQSQKAEADRTEAEDAAVQTRTPADFVEAVEEITSGGQIAAEPVAQQAAKFETDQPEQRDPTPTHSSRGDSSANTEEVEPPASVVMADIDVVDQPQAVQEGKQSVSSSAVTVGTVDDVEARQSQVTVKEFTDTTTYDAVDDYLEQPSDQVHPHPKGIEEAVKPDAGEAVVATADSTETQETYEEMSDIRPEECPMIMNRE